jgi:hypothetical protein
MQGILEFLAFLVEGTVLALVDGFTAVLTLVILE